MLCFHAQYKECLSLSWNADLSFFLITITCSYFSIRAIAQQPLARFSPGFSEAQTFHKKAISGMRLHLSQSYTVLVLSALSSVTANAFTNTHWASLWREDNGLGSCLACLRHWRFQLLCVNSKLKVCHVSFTDDMASVIFSEWTDYSQEWANVSVMTEIFTGGFHKWVSLWLLHRADSQHKATWKDELVDPMVFKITHKSIICQFSLSEEASSKILTSS